MQFKPYLELAKIRLTVMVLITTTVGFILGSPGPVAYGRLFWTILGTGLAAAGASTMNQLLEIRRDGLMERTRNRPLPAGRITPGVALAFAFVASFGGLGILNETVDSLCAALGTLNLRAGTATVTLKDGVPQTLDLAARVDFKDLLDALESTGMFDQQTGWEMVAPLFNIDPAALPRPVDFPMQFAAPLALQNGV